MMGRIWIAWMAALALALVAGCSDDDGPGNGQPDGSVDATADGDLPDSDLPDSDLPDSDLPDGDLPDGDLLDGDLLDGDVPHCVSLGGECATTAECCGGRLCEDDGSGLRRCIDETYCKGTGTACTRAAECCSLSCDGTCQGDGSLCKPSGTECGADTECCSNDCTGDTCEAIGDACSTIGETCSEEGYDEGCCSKLCRNLGSEEEPDLRCARASSCGARGEICGVDADCCSGVCLDGRCPLQSEIGQKLFAGEPCRQDSDCASYLCASNYPGGPTVCQFLGGCRPTGEICTADWQCCSDIHYTGNSCPDSYEDGNGCVPHLNEDRTDGVPGLSTCGDQKAQTGPKEPGEICGDSAGGDVHQCCFDCGLSPEGVWRCEGGEGDVCVPDDGACRSSSDCCSNICSPFPVEGCDPAIEECEFELRCGQCVPTGGFCTSNADCCDFICENGVCGEGDDDDPACAPLGGSCETVDDCCDSEAICADTCQRVW